jgi:hypothetical protein
MQNIFVIKVTWISWIGPLWQLFICLRPPPLPLLGFCLGVVYNFVVSKSGVKECKSPTAYSVELQKMPLNIFWSKFLRDDEECIGLFLPM